MDLKRFLTHNTVIFVDPPFLATKMSLIASMVKFASNFHPSQEPKKQFSASEKCRNDAAWSLVWFKHTVLDHRLLTHLESNFGRHIGVQLSDNLNDSEELTRLKIKCKSAGCIK